MQFLYFSCKIFCSYCEIVKYYVFADTGKNSLPLLYVVQRGQVTASINQRLSILLEITLQMNKLSKIQRKHLFNIFNQEKNLHGD